MPDPALGLESCPGKRAAVERDIEGIEVEEDIEVEEGIEVEEDIEEDIGEDIEVDIEVEEGSKAAEQEWGKKVLQVVR